MELSARYIHDRKLPDKAIDVIDESGAAQMLVPEGKRKKTIDRKGDRGDRSPPWRASRPRPSPRTTPRCCATSRPRPEARRVRPGHRRSRRSPPRSSSRAPACVEPEKPIGYYLFSGPTGVGKTEVAKQLSQVLGVQLLRFDMSEYMERHTVSRLIGAPPGYVGFDQGGLLTDGIDQNPLLRAAARRDREGPSGPLQHPPADHGPREADRSQRQAGRLPQRDPHHDHQCGRVGSCQAGDRLHPQQEDGRRRRGDQPPVHAGIPQPSRRGHRRSAISPPR